MSIPSRIPDYSEWSSLPRVRDLGRAPRIGELVVVRSRGTMRVARITKVGTSRITVEYTTANALREAERGAPLIVTRPSVRFDDDWLRLATQALAEEDS